MFKNDKIKTISDFKQNISFKYILKPSYCNLKKINRPKLLLFLYVSSAPSNFDRRELIRQSWYKNSKLRVLFLIGDTEDKNLAQQIYLEHKTYNDILQANFTDNYNNLTLKTLLGFHFTANIVYCNYYSSFFVAKIDDDVLVNTKYLLTYLKELIALKPAIRNTFICNLNTNSSVNRIYGHKFYVSKEEFIEDNYKKYCDGPAYIYTSDLAKKLLNTAKYTKLFRFEDVYVGMLAAKLNCDYIDIYSKYSSPNDIDYLMEKKEIFTKMFFYPINKTNFKELWLKINVKI